MDKQIKQILVKKCEECGDAGLVCRRWTSPDPLYASGYVDTRSTDLKAYVIKVDALTALPTPRLAHKKNDEF